MTASADDLTRHPIRGALWGLLLGLGAALLLVAYNVVALGTLPPLTIVGAGLVLGGLWGAYAPPRRPGERATPSRETPPETPQPDQPQPDPPQSD